MRSNCRSAVSRETAVRASFVIARPDSADAGNQVWEDRGCAAVRITCQSNPVMLASLICRPCFANACTMTIARISELERKTTQSGKANSGRWLLEFERQQPLRPDPLTGWNGSGDTRPQVRMTFPTKDAAVAYCDKHQLPYHVVPAPAIRLKLQAYADNFR